MKQGTGGGEGRGAEGWTAGVGGRAEAGSGEVGGARRRAGRDIGAHFGSGHLMGDLCACVRVHQPPLIISLSFSFPPPPASPAPPLPRPPPPAAQCPGPGHCSPSHTTVLPCFACVFTCGLSSSCPLPRPPTPAALLHPPSHPPAARCPGPGVHPGPHPDPAQAVVRPGQVVGGTWRHYPRVPPGPALPVPRGPCAQAARWVCLLEVG